MLAAMIKAGGGSAAGIVFSVVTTKVVATALGPNGVGLLSLLRQGRQTAVVVASLNASPAIARGIASRAQEERNKFSVAAFWILGGNAGLVCSALMVFAPEIASYLNAPTVSPNLIRWMATPIAVGVLLAYLNGILQAHRAVGRYVACQIAMSASTLGLAYPMSRMAAGGNWLALVWMMLGSSVVAATLALHFVGRAGWLPQGLARLELASVSSTAKEFAAIGGASLAVTAADSVVILLLRGYLAGDEGLAAAGVFDVAWTVSSTYVMLILASFGTYYLPTLTMKRSQQEKAAVIGDMMRVANALFIPLAIAVVLGKALVVTLLYSTEFLPALKILRWTLMGDGFKIASWVLMTPLLAAGRAKIFLLVEGLRQALFLTLSWLALYHGGMDLELIGASFLVAHATGLIVLMRINSASTPLTARSTWVMLAGFVALGGMSAATWDDTSVIAWKVGIGMPVAILIAFLSFTPDERLDVWRRGWVHLRRLR